MDFTDILRNFVIGICVFFGILIFLNSGLSLILNSQKSQQAALVSKISSYSDLEKTAKEVDSKTISEISLTSANLNVTTGKFEVEMGGKFK